MLATSRGHGYGCRGSLCADSLVHGFSRSSAPLPGLRKGNRVTVQGSSKRRPAPQGPVGDRAQFRAQHRRFGPSERCVRLHPASAPEGHGASRRGGCGAPGPRGGPSREPRVRGPVAALGAVGPVLAGRRPTGREAGRGLGSGTRTCRHQGPSGPRAASPSPAPPGCSLTSVRNRLPERASVRLATRLVTGAGGTAWAPGAAPWEGGAAGSLLRSRRGVSPVTVSPTAPPLPASRTPRKKRLPREIRGAGPGSPRLRLPRDLGSASVRHSPRALCPRRSTSDNRPPPGMTGQGDGTTASPGGGRADAP